MKIEEGKIYLTKSGERIGPVAWDGVTRLWRRGPEFSRNTGDYWHKDGKRFGYVDDELDLIEEAAE